MLTTCLIAALAAAAPVASPPVASPPAPRPRVQVLEFTTTGEAAIATTVTRIVTVELSKHGYDVLTSADLQAVVNVEAERQAVGCADSSCLADIASAMGVDYVVYGDVLPLNKQLLVTLNLFDGSQGRALGREQLQVNDLDALPDAVSRAVARLKGAPEPAAPVAEDPLLPVGQLVTSAGAGVLVVGGIVAGTAYTINGQASAKRDVKDTAQWLFPLGLTVAGVGLVGAAVGVVVWGLE